MSEWHTVTLGDFISLRRGYDLPARDRTQGHVPVIGSGGVVGCHGTAMASGPGVTVGRAANLGSPYFVNCSYWPLNTTLYVDDFRGNDPHFVYYLFATLDLTGFNSGSVQPMLNRNYIRGVSIWVPSPSEQREIAALLGALDEKIAVNGKVSKVCLELASSRYKQASLSPSWVDLSLKDAGTWHSGGTPSTSHSEYWGGHIPWISAASLRSAWVWDSDRRLTKEGAVNGTRLTPAGSVVFVVRGMSLKTEFRVGLAQREIAFGQDCKAIVTKAGLNPHLVLHGLLAQTPEILDLVDEAGHGTGRLATDRIGSLTIRVPGHAEDPVIGELESYDCLMASREKESGAMARLRDTLLPKLMSGEIRVRDAEKVVEDVT